MEVVNGSLVFKVTQFSGAGAAQGDSSDIALPFGRTYTAASVQAENDFVLVKWAFSSGNFQPLLGRAEAIMRAYYHNAVARPTYWPRPTTTSSRLP